MYVSMDVCGCSRVDVVVVVIVGLLARYSAAVLVPLSLDYITKVRSCARERASERARGTG